METLVFPARRSSEDITLKRGQRDRLGNEIFCQTGTIPMRRLTLEQMASFRTLAAFLSKTDGEKDPNRPADDSDHYYARGVQFVDNLGGDSWLNLWSPTVSAGRMSLSQQWFVSGEGDAKQTIESGWQVMPGTWHIDNAALFIYHTTKGYADKSGCYNIECAGFVQIANNVYLGRGFTSYSSIDGTSGASTFNGSDTPMGTGGCSTRDPATISPSATFRLRCTAKGGNEGNEDRVRWEDTGKPSALEMGSGRKASETGRRRPFRT